MLGASSIGVGMGDSTAMTIEFLRARLLSERTVSRTARQRADQLARRVVELEEQLRIMVIQRKKAEKAASEVISILENREGDPSEVIDSSSDQEDEDGKSKQDDVKEYGTSDASRMEKNETEDGLSGTEPEVSPFQGRSLSWKGRSSSPDSHEKQKIKYRQRHRASSFTSVTEPSEKHLLGKSCRKIKRKETRSATQDGLDNLMFDDHGEKAASWSYHSDEHPACPQETSEVEMDRTRRDRYEEMEKVLEQQAKLIGQFEAEENAQREWEEKYNENKITTLHAVSETVDEAKETATVLAGKSTYRAENAETVPNTEEPTAPCSPVISLSTVETPHSTDSGSSNEVTALGRTNGSVLPDPTRSGGNSFQASSDAVRGHQYNATLLQDTETGSQEFAFPAQEPPDARASNNQGQVFLLGNIDSGYHIKSSTHTHGNGIQGSPSTGSPSSVNSGNIFSKSRSPDIQNEVQRLRPQSPSKRLGGVLQALQHAKVSLGQLGGLPSSNPGSLATVAATDPHLRAIKYGGDLDIPVVPTGLFRLPTDSYPQTSLSMPKVYGSGLSLPSSYPDVGYGISHTEYQYPTATYAESRSRVSVGRQYFDPYITSITRMPSSTRHSLPYSHLTTERTSAQDGFPRPEIVLRNEFTAGDQYNVYGSDGALTDIRRL